MYGCAAENTLAYDQGLGDSLTQSSQCFPIRGERHPSQPDTRRRYLPQTPERTSTIAKDYAEKLPNSLSAFATLPVSYAKQQSHRQRMPSHNRHAAGHPFLAANDVSTRSDQTHHEPNDFLAGTITKGQGLWPSTSGGRTRTRSGSEQLNTISVERVDAGRRCSSPSPGSGRRALPSLDVVTKQRFSAWNRGYREEFIDDEIPCFPCDTSAEKLGFDDDSVYEETLDFNERLMSCEFTSGSYRSRSQSERAGGLHPTSSFKRSIRRLHNAYDDFADNPEPEKSQVIEEEQQLLGQHTSRSVDHMSRSFLSGGAIAFPRNRLTHASQHVKSRNSSNDVHDTWLVSDSARNSPGDGLLWNDLRSNSSVSGWFFWCSRQTNLSCTSQLI